jgi:hypothetical protein
MKLLEELAPAVKMEAPAQLQLLGNAAIALDASGRSNCNKHSPWHDHCSPSNPEIVLPHQPAQAIRGQQIDEAMIAQEVAALEVALREKPTSMVSGGAQ